MLLDGSPLHIPGYLLGFCRVLRRLTVSALDCSNLAGHNSAESSVQAPKTVLYEHLVYFEVNEPLGYFEVTVSSYLVQTYRKVKALGEELQ